MEYIYDTVPYPSLSYAQSHPDRLATVATLLGMAPAPIDRCRVLELGCAGGWNLIPMAYGLPGSEFVGIDNSARQITEGQAIVKALDLPNIALEPLDILDADASLGQFDYIIAHGVFSWVPKEVQDAILELCKRNLAPNGVAYISYNAYPGWRMLGIIRDMMLYHTRALSDPQEKAIEARALLDFLAESVPAESGAYGSFLNMYAQMLQGELKGSSHRGNSFLLHDELEEVNEPFYFYEFAERAANSGLQYLGEAEMRSMMDTNFPPQVSAGLRQISNSIIDLEQYMDFLRNQTFRKTLLCHDDVVLSRTLTTDQLRSFYVASYARPTEPEPDIHAVSKVGFRSPEGAMLSIDHPVTKAAMCHLGEIWPRMVRVDELHAAARARLGMGEPTADDPNAVRDAQVLGANLLKAHTYSGSLVELHVHAPRVVTEVSERPIASAVARLQAREGDRVTNVRHERVELDQLNLYLLPFLDGSHDRAALVERLEEGPVASGLLVIQDDEGVPIEDRDKIRDLLGESVDVRLQWLARAGILIG